MKAAIKKILFLTTISLFLGAATVFCEGKSTKEEKEKKKVDLGKPLTIWLEDWSGKKITQFAITFTKAGYELISPIQPTFEVGKVIYFIDYVCENLGPRQESPNFNGIEIKTEKGYIYSGYSKGAAFLDPGKQDKGRLQFMIPPDAVPVEATGTNFSLRLPAIGISRSEVEIVTISNRNLQVNRCCLTGFGKEPILYLQYKNIGDKTLDIKIAIEWIDKNRQIQGQKDFRGSIIPGQSENLFYRIGVTNPQQVIRYVVDLATKEQGHRGLLPFKWNWHKSYPRVGPSKIQRKTDKRSVKSEQIDIFESSLPEDKADNGSDGVINDIPDDQMIWVKCYNSQCKAEYQMGEKAYHKAIQDRMTGIVVFVTPALICKKCGKPSVYKAYKCTNPDCGFVFRAGSVPNDFSDRCPKCGQSETEEIRKRRISQRSRKKTTSGISSVPVTSEREVKTSVPNSVLTQIDPKLISIEVELPKPAFIGTPQDTRVHNLEKPLGRPRPPFLAPEGTKNVAASKPISGSDKEQIIGELEMITDGDKEAADGSYVELGPFVQHVTIDLEAMHEIYAIVVWHYHKQARVYFDVVVQVAEDADFITNVKTVFNNDIDNSADLGVGKDMHYTETYEGKLIDAKGVEGRYVRLWSNGNTSNDLNHYVEVEVYGRPTKKLNSDLAEPESSGKQELVEALKGLENATIKKIQWDVETTAQCFTSVKEYWRGRWLADILGPVLRIIQNTLSVVCKVMDASTLPQQLNSSLNNSQYVCEFISVGFMVNGLVEAGGRLQYALDGPSYANTIKEMLKAADRSTTVNVGPGIGFKPEYYQRIIKNCLEGEQNTPLIIARTSKLAPDNKPARGALILYRSIREEFRQLIDLIESNELPQDFPIKEVIAEVEQLKKQIIASGDNNINVNYSIYEHGRRVPQSRTLGAIAEHKKAFDSIAKAVADRVQLEIHAEYAQLVGTGADAAYIVTYNIPGARETAKVAQQVTFLPEIVIEGEKTFNINPEDEFYQIPQEMIFSLAIEFSNLLRIADDTVFSLMPVLERTQSSEADLPIPRDYVLDNANVVTISDEHSLNDIFNELEQKTGAQYVILTVLTTHGLPIERFALEHANKWKIGQKDKNNGMFFVLAKNDRRWRFEVGYGLERFITGEYCGRIGREVLVPHLRQGNYSKGIYQANIRIANKIANEYGCTLSRIHAIMPPVGGNRENDSRVDLGEGVSESEKSQKTFYDQAEEDKEGFLAKPQALDIEEKQIEKKKVESGPTILYFKPLSEIDKTEAKKLLSLAVSGRSVGRLPMTGFKLMVDNCRKIIRNWPDSWYAYRAKRMLADIPEQYQKRYGLTNEEMDVSRFAESRPGTQPFKVEQSTQPILMVKGENSGSRSQNSYDIIRNSIGMKLVWIPAGSFMMGSAESAAKLAREYDTMEEYFTSELPQHQVTISEGFWMSVCEVTQTQWQAVMGSTVRQQRDKQALEEKDHSWRLRGEGADYPMYYVSWHEAVEFCNKLSHKEGKTYRLPTEAEWEYACRAGSKTRFSFGDSDSLLGEYAWYRENSDESTHPVGQKRPNAFGLYDMHGNLWEWCSDWRGKYTNGLSVDPQGPSTGKERVLRGGSWDDDPECCFSTTRFSFTPTWRNTYFGGIRVVLVDFQ